MTRQLDADFGLADAGDVSLDRFHASTFSNSGSQISPCCSKITRTRSPMSTASTGQPTMLVVRSEEHTSELQSLMRLSYAVFCLKKKNTIQTTFICLHTI